MTRSEQIKAGNLWQVYPPDSEAVLFEGSRAACLRYIREHGLNRQWKRGGVRLGCLIWEPLLPIAATFARENHFSIPVKPSPYPIIIGEARRLNCAVRINP
jgi:hypothetical protein